jgi:23S rRNA (cytidine1920-2'-O)/16S rRNA (cytidine1409-2'-O)-methyltransferase
MPPLNRKRLDVLLVERGLVPSRHRAQALILSNAVLVNDQPLTKAGTLLGNDVTIRLREDPNPFVSRGGMKLSGALDHWGLHPEGVVALDLGISTGGFTDCLLQRNAKRVYGVDVGKGQVAWKLQQDPRVVLFEGRNARFFDPALLPEPVSWIVADLSFISLTLVLPVMWKALETGGICLPMVKPQFEVGRADVGKQGVVRDPDKREHAVDRVQKFAEELGFLCHGRVASPLPGPKGNVEFFLYLERRP